MTSKHTPGPWHVTPLELGDGFSVYHNGPILYVKNNTHGAENAKANAYLIAAAPDMLNALKGIIEYLETGRVDGVFRDDKQMAQACRAAIAAEGLSGRPIGAPLEEGYTAKGGAKTT